MYINQKVASENCPALMVYADYANPIVKTLNFWPAEQAFKVSKCNWRRRGIHKLPCKMFILSPPGRDPERLPVPVRSLHLVVEGHALLVPSQAHTPTFPASLKDRKESHEAASGFRVQGAAFFGKVSLQFEVSALSLFDG